MTDRPSPSLDPAGYNLWYKGARKEKIKEQRKGYRERRRQHIREQVRENKFKSRYGINTRDYNWMVFCQGGECAICGEEKKLTVDHDHATGKVRGLLCGDCNRAIGLLKENLGTLRKAIKYLKNEQATNISGRSHQPRDRQGALE